MRWTPVQVAELRALAPTGVGARAIGVRLGCSQQAIFMKAFHLGVHIAKRRRTPASASFCSVAESPISEPAADLRSRWTALIGPMRVALRADVEREMTR